MKHPFRSLYHEIHPTKGGGITESRRTFADTVNNHGRSSRLASGGNNIKSPLRTVKKHCFAEKDKGER